MSGLLCTVNYVSNGLGLYYSACSLPASSIAPLRSAKSLNTSSSSGTLSFFSRAMPLSCTSC